MLRFVDDYEDMSGFEFQSNRSYLHGAFLADQPDELYWTIHIEWYNPGESEHYFRGAMIEIRDLDFHEADWRRIQDQDICVSYAAEAVHPILPGSPAIFFAFSSHAIPNQNHIVLLNRGGATFDVKWTCNMEYLGPPWVQEGKGHPLELEETIALQRFSVVFQEPRDIDLAVSRRLVLNHFNETEVGEPVVSGEWVTFPINLAQ